MWQILLVVPVGFPRNSGSGDFEADFESQPRRALFVMLLSPCCLDLWPTEALVHDASA